MTFLNLSPTEQQRQVQAALLEDYQERKRADDRAADDAYHRDEVATRSFLAQMRGQVATSPIEGALGQMALVDATEEIDQRRCEAELARWRAGGGTFPALRALLGVPQQRERAAMADSQARLRARHREAEAAKNTLEKRVDQLERENAWLRSQQDRTVEALASQRQATQVVGKVALRAAGASDGVIAQLEQGVVPDSPVRYRGAGKIVGIS